MIRTELSELKAVIEWRDWNSNRDPRIKMLYHIPNGEARNATTGAKLKAMGVRAGMPDLHLPVPRFARLGGESKFISASLYIEMKGEKGRVSRKQYGVHDDLVLNFNQVIVCYSAKQAIDTIVKYLGLDDSYRIK